MRLRVSIPRVEPGEMEAPDVCPYDDCNGRYFKPHQQNCDKSVRDTKYNQVNAMRRELYCFRRNWRKASIELVYRNGGESASC